MTFYVGYSLSGESIILCILSRVGYSLSGESIILCIILSLCRLFFIR